MADFDREQEALWPSIKRSLHDEGPDWAQTANLAFGRGDAYPRICGFRVAAELLAAYVRDHERAADGLIFPLLYSWRQHIELALKDLIVEAELLAEYDSPTPPAGHNLIALWQRFRCAIGSKGTPSELANVQHVIGELHAMDPTGEAFRYAWSKKRTPTLAAVHQLSLQSVNTALGAVANFLDAAATGISVELEAKAELLREYAQDSGLVVGS